MRAGHVAVAAILGWLSFSLPALADNEFFTRGNWQDQGIEFRIAMQPVQENGLTGELYLPKDAVHRPALLALGAYTQPSLRGMAQGMADHGYPTLALFYCGPGTARPDLRETPLEIFKTAIDWLARQPSVDPDHIGVIGASAGATAALLAAARDSRIRAVVAIVPGNVVWQAPVPDVPAASMYAANGVPLPFVHGPDASLPVDSRLSRMRESLEKPLRGAVIPVEHINGPILLLAGEEDRSWPSAAMAKKIVARLRERHFRFHYESEVYADAGHGFFAAHDSSDPWFSALYARLMNPSAFPGMGGTVDGNRVAQQDSWPKTLAFLHRYL
jgi:dienelactone hydrolase